MTSIQTDPLLKYREQHKKRLSYMPWLYFGLKPKNLVWAQAWQQEYQDYLRSVESIQIGDNCFISPDAHLFAEPNREIIIGDGSFIAADCVLHGPIKLGEKVALNHHCTLDGGRMGIEISTNSRLAAYCHLYAFNHGMKLDNTIHAQAVSSEGIFIGEDVWLGANVGVVDRVNIHDYAVIGMDSTVTRDVEAYAIMAGSPAKKIGDRRDKK